TEPAEATDALVTATPGVVPVVLVADCVPVLLGDAEAGVVAAVHAGRVGARVGVVPAAIEAMRSVGAEPSRTEALLGPSVCGSCYEVPADMADDVEAHLPGSRCTSAKGTAALDLRAGLWRQLADLGVGKIGVDPRCTVEDETLFSHRRDQPAGPAALWSTLMPRSTTRRARRANRRTRSSDARNSPSPCAPCGHASTPPVPRPGA